MQVNKDGIKSNKYCPTRAIQPIATLRLIFSLVAK